MKWVFEALALDYYFILQCLLKPSHHTAITISPVNGESSSKSQSAIGLRVDTIQPPLFSFLCQIQTILSLLLAKWITKFIVNYINIGRHLETTLNYFAPPCMDHPLLQSYIRPLQGTQCPLISLYTLLFVLLLYLLAEVRLVIRVQQLHFRQNKKPNNQIIAQILIKFKLSFHITEFYSQLISGNSPENLQSGLLHKNEDSFPNCAIFQPNIPHYLIYQTIT